MDPSMNIIYREEEDESLHAFADVGAMTEAFYRKILGFNPTKPVASITNGNAGILTQDDSSTTLKNNLQFTEHPTMSEKVKNFSSCYQNQHIDYQLQCDHRLLQHGNTHCDLQQGHSDKFSQQNVDNSPSQDIHQHSKVQQQKVEQFNNQQLPNTDLSNNSLNWKIPTNSLKLEVLVPQIKSHDKDRSMLLRALYIKLLNNEISKENYLKVCKKVVGDRDRMIREAAVHQAQMQLQAQVAWELNQKQYLSHAPVPECKIDVNGGHVAQAYATGGSAANNLGLLSKVSTKALSNTQQHPPTVQRLFSMNGSSFQAHAYPRPSIGTTSTSLKLQNLSSTVNPSIASSKAVSTQPMNIATIQNDEMYKAVKNHKNMHYGSTSQMLNQHHKQVAQQTLLSRISIKEPACGSQTMDYVGQDSIGHDLEYLKKHQFSVPQSTAASVYGDKGHETLKDELHERKLSNACCPINSSAIGKTTSPAAVVTNSIMQNQVQSQSRSLSLICGTNIKSSPSKPPIGKEMTLECLGNSPPKASKKQKTSGAFLDQSIEQFNDVTAVSGVNLRAEEEQLLVARTEETRASEEIQRVVQEEEERSILQKGPLQKKLTQIISRCGLGGISEDVEYCLSMCVGERLRNLIGNSIKLSKQRVDIENKRHKLVTSDIQHQILTLNQKAKKEWEKKQAEESEKFWKLDNDSADAESNVEKDKDDRPSKKHKREEDDKMRTTAANAAARAAIGVDDMLSKWQLMAEQARQKRESELGVSSLNFRENMGNLEEDGGMSRNGRSIGNLSNPTIDRTICIKDLIAALEKEPMMSKSTLLYRLYERTSSSHAAG